MKRITVFYGNYGSGKTEVSLNVAIGLKREHERVTLVDLDIVNPYFRSSGHKATLEALGIRVVSPVFANTAVDVPSLPPDIYAAFKGGYAVFDCGGDPVGASALGSLKTHFDAARDDTQALFVVNTRRPFQQNAREIADSLDKVQYSARLNPDGVVLNTNLGAETTGELLAEGYQIIREFEQNTGIPLLYVSGTPETLRSFQLLCPECSAETLPITPMTRPDWL